MNNLKIEIRRNKAKEYARLLSTIRNKNLKYWAAAIIWWEECRFDDAGWSEFEKKFVKKYNHRHNMSESKLYEALNKIGYKTPSSIRFIVGKYSRKTKYKNQLISQ